MPETLWVDFETYSKTDIKKHGAYRYITDISTNVYCMGYAFDDEPVHCWVNYDGHEFPADIIAHIKAGGIIYAHNAGFERLVFWYVLCPDFGFAEPRITQFRCSAARARAHGLPSGLNAAMQALDLPFRKQPEGSRLIRNYSARGVLWKDIPPDDQALWLDYVCQDVEVMRTLVSCLRDLTADEWREYHINELINDRGIPLDVPFITAAQEYGATIRRANAEQLADTTGGKVRKYTDRRARDEWLLPQLLDEHIEALTVTTGGVNKISFTAERRRALAEMANVPPVVRAYLRLVEDAGGATLAKYTALLNREVDGRLMGALVFNGAGQTGRYASQGAQIHNMSRDTLDNPEAFVHAVQHNQRMADPAGDLKRGIRAAIHNPDGLTWYDFSAIEGRVAPWLADSPAGEEKLDVYRRGEDPYILNAAKTFNVHRLTVSKEQRQYGKIQELALQFLGGVGALQGMASGYGITLDEDTALTLRDGWRAANPWAKQFGYALDRALWKAYRHPGEEAPAGRVSFVYDGSDWLWCRLPSGRLLAYLKPKVEMIETPWGEEQPAITVIWGAGRPRSGVWKWPRRKLFAGLLLENCTQATAADLLRSAIVRAHEAGLKIIMHVHDEIVIEGTDVERLGEIMLNAPAWADGLPLAGEGGSGTRYGK